MRGKVQEICSKQGFILQTKDILHKRNEIYMHTGMKKWNSIGTKRILAIKMRGKFSKIENIKFYRLFSQLYRISLLYL